MKIKETSTKLQKMVFDASKRYRETGRAYHHGQQDVASYLIEIACQIALDEAVGNPVLTSSKRAAAMANLTLLINNFTSKKELTEEELKMVYKTGVESAAITGYEPLMVQICDDTMNYFMDRKNGKE